MTSLIFLEQLSAIFRYFHEGRISRPTAERKKYQLDLIKEAQKVAEMLRKQKRKEEMEMKRKEKEELAEKKKQEREERKRKQSEKVKEKRDKSKKRKRNESSSSSDGENVKVEYMESDGSYDESKICPGCRTDDALGDQDEWIRCQKCPRYWHVSCTGEAILLEIPTSQLKNYPFYCEFCI